ncbi:MAG: tetratricopeptide repeat protein [Thermoanaerobaculia bacterium]
MPSSNVDWVPTIGMFVIALVVGAVIVYLLSRRSGASPRIPSTLDLELRDLAGKRDALIQQLRELEDTASKRTASQLSSERTRLEIEAAEILRQLDRAHAGDLTPTAAVTGTSAGTHGTGSALSEEPEAVPSGFLAQHPALKGFLWGAGSILVIGGLAFFVSRSATDRNPNGSPTGGGMEMPASAQQQPQMDPAIAQQIEMLQKAVDEKPDDFGRRLDLAAAYLMANDMMGVFNQTQYVLDKDPNNARALSYQALVRLSMNQGDMALEMLKKATTIDPDLLDGWVHLALVQFQLGHPDEARAAIDEAARHHPDQKAALDRLYGELERASAAQSSGAQAAMPAATPAAAPDDGRNVGIDLELDPSVRSSVSPGAVLFVFARPAGQRQGPPIAAKRLQAGSFPMHITIGSADSMMGQPLPDRIHVEARIDADGNAMTHSADDIAGEADNVASGASGVRIVLHR